MILRDRVDGLPVVGSCPSKESRVREKNRHLATEGALDYSEDPGIVGQSRPFSLIPKREKDRTRVIFRNRAPGALLEIREFPKLPTRILGDKPSVIADDGIDVKFR